ncbi:MAG: MFS transporter [Deltaproteobacteria bacterium]|nr:MFS transporter [Deltaproteobacteria bacterium]
MKTNWVIFSLVAIAVFMSTLDSSIVNIALPVIMKDLNVPFTTIGWVPMIYLLTVSALLLPFGRLSDIKGRMWVYCRGFFIFSIASLLCGVAPNAIWLIAARSLQGIAAAMLMACSPALIVDTFPAAERGKALGMVGTVVAAGLTAGPVLGGLIINSFSWRAIFLINIPIGIVSAILAFQILKDGKGNIDRKEPFDWKGALMLTFGFSLFIYVISNGYAWGFASLRTILLLITSIIAIGLFLQVEKRTDYPMFQTSLLKIRIFMLPVISASILYISLFAMVFLMPFYLVYPCGFAIDKVGYTMVIPFVFLFFVSPLSGSISDRIGSRMLCTLGMLVISIALFFLSRLTPTHAYISIAWPLALMGIGTGIFVSPNNATIMTVIPQAHRGAASGTVATSRNMGMVIGVAMSGLIFSSIFHSLSGGLTLKVYKPGLEAIFITAFKWAMLAGGVVAGIGVVVSFLRGPETTRIKQ